MHAPISFHARTRKYDRLCGWYEWSVTSVHFDLLGVPLTVESLDSADGSYTIDECFTPVCSMDGVGRLGVTLRIDPPGDDEVTAIEIAIVEEDLAPIIERLVKLSIERGSSGEYPVVKSCGAYDVASPTGGVWTGEDDIMTAFADDNQQAQLEEAQSMLLAAWAECQSNLVPPMDPTPPVSESVDDEEMDEEETIENRIEMELVTFANADGEVRPAVSPPISPVKTDKSEKHNDGKKSPIQMKKNVTFKVEEEMEVESHKETEEDSENTRADGTVTHLRDLMIDMDPPPPLDHIVFRPVGDRWMNEKCILLGLQRDKLGSRRDFVHIREQSEIIKEFQTFFLSYHIVTEAPDRKNIIDIDGDGNSLFRALSWWITGSDHGHLNLRRTGEWGTECEIYGAATLLGVDIYVFSEGRWERYSPLFEWSAVDGFEVTRVIGEDERTRYSLYLSNDGNMHYDVVFKNEPCGKRVRIDEEGKEKISTQVRSLFTGPKINYEETKRKLEEVARDVSKILVRRKNSISSSILSFTRRKNRSNGLSINQFPYPINIIFSSIPLFSSSFLHLPPPSLPRAMLWAVGPIAAASTAALALAAGCAKGRDDNKLAKTQRSSGKSHKNATSSGKSTRSAKSGRPPGQSKSARAGGKPSSSRAGDKSARSSKSGRAGDKSGRSSKSGRVAGKPSSSRAGDKSGRSSKSGRAGDKSGKSSRSGKSGRSGSKSKSAAVAGVKKEPTGKPPKAPAKLGSKEQLSSSSSKDKKEKALGAAAGGAAGAAVVAKTQPKSEQKNGDVKKGSQREKRKDGSQRSGRSGRSKSKRSSRSKKDSKGPSAVGVAADKSGRSSKRSKRSSRSKRSKRSSKDSKKAAAAVAPKSVAAAVAVDKAAAGAASAALATGPPTKIASAPRLDMRVEPMELHYQPTGGVQKVTINNTSDKRKAIKVKCSDNLLYRVNPVHTFVEPGGSTKVDVLRQNGAAKIDKIVVVAAEASKDDKCAKTACASAASTDMLILPLIAATAE
ncbi:hypothetical protein PRIPAC_93425 [Pristionchus pacificus]|uniref:Major sperm protein n=1 Tax=Pristionchus pacificus TaxID=54126 RepID=A0A2A6BPW4_PRIPA|nr:hypothetical protein PRIPAC_93425 [Pristionchus pacificus]|eukprot:PDM67954.1 MSP domain-containing protein [Pristionchus pacificus]